MSIPTYSLTTLTRVKARRAITESGFDSLFEALIREATSIIEGECEGRRFASTPYTDQIYSRDADQQMVFLRHWPITAISAAEYRAGTPDVPAWTSLLGSEYEIEDGLGGLNKGIARIYGATAGINTLRFSYTAGYVIDWTTEANHTLPWEITDLCERVVIAMFNRRTDEGKAQMSSQDLSITWQELISSPEDKRILLRYCRPRFA